MIVMGMKRFLAATLFVIIWRKVQGIYNKSYLPIVSGDCGFNHYFNGKDCEECHSGTYGMNCSQICPPSTYGRLCIQECNCSIPSCHHVYGCNDRSTAMDWVSTIFGTFTGTTSSTPEVKTERGIDKDISTITGYIHYEKILVILAGTVSSLTLLLLIAREIFKLFRISESSGGFHVGMVTPVVNNTSDITEALYNSRGTQD